MSVGSPYDCWAFARIMAGETLNGELEHVGERLRPLAARMNELPATDRQSLFDAAMSTAWSDEEAVALTRAIADADPSAPIVHAAGEEWGPILSGALPPVLPFPLDVLPPSTAEFARLASRSIGCPEDFPALFVLPTAAGAIGRSAALRLKDGYFARASIFVCGVGDPGDGKTAALDKATAGAEAIELALKAAFGADLEQWEAACNPPGPPSKDKAPKPPRPRRRRLVVDEATVESLVIRMANNPRGLVMNRDELTGLFTSMGQYKGGKGNDKTIILKMWSGAPIKRDRVLQEGDDSVDVPHPMLSIAGGMQPDMLDEMLDSKRRADGSVDRFLFAYPDPLPWAPWSNRGVPEDVMDEWRRLVQKLYARPMNVKNGQDVPHVTFFTDDAERAWVRHYNEHVDEVGAPGFQPAMKGPWSKLKEYAGRLALILALMEHAADPTSDPMDVPRVDVRHVEGAWRLVAYFKTHARRVHAAITRGVSRDDAKALDSVRAWIASKPRTSFKVAAVSKARHWIEDDELRRVIDHLVRMNVIRPAAKREEAGAKKVGRKPTPSYEVNPALYAEHATPELEEAS